MSQMGQPGGFGGPRIVKPQANVYTVLLVVACLFMGAALAWQVWNIMKLREPPAAPAKTGAAPSSLVIASADRPVG